MNNQSNNNTWVFSIEEQNATIVKASDKTVYKENFATQTERAQSCIQISNDIKARVNNAVAFETEFKDALGLKYKGLHTQESGFFVP